MAKIHHALVDGKSALEVALLLFDLERNVVTELPVPWEPAPTPGTGRLAAGALVAGGEELLRTARGAERLAGEPRAAPWQPTAAVEGGNERFSVLLDDGRRVFVKAAQAEHTAAWLRREHEIYAHLRGSFMPGLVAFEDDPVYPILVLEDLGDADWEVRWDPGRVALVRAALVELAGREGLVLMPGHTFLYSPAVNKVRELIDSGELGEIYFVTSSRMNLGIYQADGVVADLAPHDLSILLYWLDRPVATVAAQGCTVFQSGVPEAAFLTLRFADGPTANVQVSWLAPRKVRQMVVVGSKQMVIYDDTALDEVRARFGPTAITRAVLLGRDRGLSMPLLPD